MTKFGEILKNDKLKFFRILFVSAVLIVMIIFLILQFCGKNIIGNFIFQNYSDYFADFFNHARFASEGNPYMGAIGTLQERWAPPLHYLVLSWLSNSTDFTVVPTLFRDGYSFPPLIAQSIFMGNFFIILPCIMLFIILFDNMNFKNKLLKYALSMAFIFSAPILFELERGNWIIWSVLFVSVYFFYYDRNCNPQDLRTKIIREISLISLAIAANLKFLPALFSATLLFQKRYKDFWRFCIYSFVILMLSFSFLEGGLYNVILMLQNAIINRLAPGYNNISNLIIWVPLILIPFFFLKNIFKEKWYLLTFLTILLTSSDNFCLYRLLYFLPIIVLFLNKDKFKPIDILYSVGFLLITSPVQILDSRILGIILLEIGFYTEIVKYYIKSGQRG